ncbi:odorant receptor 131-2-like [Dicentrarchus labrax]|uniref:odorant receptor 131-2-like n=1 Tax=Dicentrarchus labrax TaxID=13489 RepID=UPI0021F5643F|nr:odorant receptor 131-2-like [Dicentrarchus labrax]
MSTQSQTNVTIGLGFLERVMLSTLTTLPCCVFLFINGTMLFTLRSKLVFCETSRYILLYNLLFSDTIQMSLSQLLYLLSAWRLRLTYPVCGLLVMFAGLTNEVSPLTLVVMSLERYVAVCYPLRHATIITIRNTAVAIIVVWAFCSLNVLTRVLLLLDFPFSDLGSLQMTDLCNSLVMSIGPMSDIYDKAYTCFLFTSAGVAVISSYIGVVIAARSASTDKASARKARNTLLLHLVQLGLTFSSTIYTQLILLISNTVSRLVRVRMQNFLYVVFFILPRCLSSLIYGLRDQTIRPILVYYLCCRLTLSPQSRLRPKINGVN